MYPNLLGQKAYHHLTDEMMGKIIGVSRNAYAAKIKSGRFTPQECRALCRYFGKPFDFLFEDPEDCTKFNSIEKTKSELGTISELSTIRK